MSERFYIATTSGFSIKPHGGTGGQQACRTLPFVLDRAYLHRVMWWPPESRSNAVTMKLARRECERLNAAYEGYPSA